MSTTPFQPPTLRWLAGSLGEPTPIQALAWPRLASGASCLLVAPTGSGKTLAAFLAAIDRWQFAAERGPGCKVVYVSPLRALAHDIERNLVQPLEGIVAAAESDGHRLEPLTVALRTGDTKPSERQRFFRRGASILITTPESLFLLLQSAAARHLATTETLIVDELHALYPSKRGSHLLVTIERLEALVGRPLQRIGLSATAPDPAAIARYLGADVEVVQSREPPRLELQVEAPGEIAPTPAAAPAPADRATPSRAAGAWPALHARLLELVLGHRSTIVFANSRRLTERLAQALNDLAVERHPELAAPLVLAHHGSLSLERRRHLEAELKAGRVRALVATSSLELGVDYAAVELVVQIESPGSVTRGLQRVGRAGHRRSETSQARLFAKHVAELPELAAVAMAMRRGELEAMVAPRQPLDVLAQQLVAIVAASERPVRVDELWTLVRRAAPYRELPREEIVKLLDLLSGHEVALPELRPLLNFQRSASEAETVTARPGALLALRSSGGTIPDRGLFSVRLADGTKIGELDEEMTYESRVGDTFLLGASAWRILSIGVDRLVVEPAGGGAGRMPFWRGDRPPRPIEVGAAMAALLADLERDPPEASRQRLREAAGFSAEAAERLLQLVAEQRQQTGRLPSLETIVVERFADEIGDDRVAVLSPFGSRVHAPWALLVAAQVEEATGVRPEVVWSEDGLALRWQRDLGDVSLRETLFGDPESLRRRLLEELAHTPLFAARFRECAARALLLLRRRPGRRRPLWLERRRGQALFARAQVVPDFPITRAALAECLDEVYDLPALERLWRDVASGRIAVHEVETRRASPMATGLSFAYMAALLYADDTPSAEQRAARLQLDEATLERLVGLPAEAMDPAHIAAVEDELQRRQPGLRVESADELFDLLRQLGPLDRTALADRAAVDVAPLVDALLASARVEQIGERLAVVGERALDDADRLARFARTHGPFTPAEAAAALDIAEAVALALLVAAPELQRAPFGLAERYASSSVVRRIRRRAAEASMAAARPASRRARLAFVARWQGLGAPRPAEALLSTVTQLSGWVAPVEAWLHHIIPARVAGATVAALDALCASGELGWYGAGRGRIALVPRRELVRSSTALEEPLSDEAQAILAVLQERFACFAAELITRLPQLGNVGLQRGLWELVWAGLISNDSLQPLAAYDERALASLPSRGVRLSPMVAGRWSILPAASGDAVDGPMAEALGLARRLVERWGIVDRPLVEASEGLRWASVGRTLKLLEERGRLRCGAFCQGGVQFGSPAAIEALRRSDDPSSAGARWVLSAHDPWSTLALAELDEPASGEALQRGPLHRADLLLVDGLTPLALYDPASGALRSLDRERATADRLWPLLGRLGGAEVQTIDGERALRSRLGAALLRLGARPLPGGLVIDGSSQRG